MLNAVTANTQEGAVFSKKDTVDKLGDAATQMLNTTFSLNLPNVTNNNSEMVTSNRNKMSNPNFFKLPDSSLSQQGLLMQTVRREDYTPEHGWGDHKARYCISSCKNAPITECDNYYELKNGGSSACDNICPEHDGDRGFTCKYNAWNVACDADKDKSRKCKVDCKNHNGSCLTLKKPGKDW